MYDMAIKEDKHARILTHAHYEQLNGIKGVIASRADSAMAPYLDHANAFFEYFVGVNDEGLPCTKSVSLTHIAHDNEDLHALIHTFIAQRLVIDCGFTTHDKRVKLAHDTLLNISDTQSGWQRLAKWLNKHHDYLMWHKQIEPDFVRWQMQTQSTSDKETSSTGKEIIDKDATDELLLTKLDLTQVQTLQQHCTINNPNVLRYIQASQQHQIDTLEKASRAQRKRFAIVAVLLVISLFAGAMAYIKQQEAVAEKERAESLLSQVRQSVNFFNFDLRDVLDEHAPTDVKVDMLQQIDTLVEALQQGGGDSADDKRQIAMSYINKANLILQSDETNPKEALPLLQEAHKIFAAQVNLEPEIIRFSNDLATSHNFLGDAYLRLGDTNKAEDQITASMTIRERILTQYPNSSGVQRSLLVSHTMLGDIYVQQGKTKKALNQFVSVIEQVKRLARTETENETYQYDLAVLHSKVGEAHLRLGGLDKAQKHLLEAVNIQSALSSQNSSNIQIKTSLASYQNTLSDIYLRSGNSDKALELVNASKEIFVTLSKQDPTNTVLQRALSVSFNKLGDIYLFQTNSNKALEHFNLALNTSQRLAEHEPNNMTFQHDLSASHNKIGDSHLLLNNLDKALEHFEMSLTIDTTLSQQDHLNGDIKSDLSIAHEKLGDVYLRYNELGKAMNHYSASLSIRSKLVKQNPMQSVFLYNLSIAHSNIGDVHLRTGEIESALDEFKASLLISQQLVDLEPSNKLYQNSLSVVNNEIGDAYFDQKNTIEALTYYEASLTVLRQYTKVFPTNIQYRQNFLHSYLTAANTYASAKNYGTAASTLKELIDLAGANVHGTSDDVNENNVKQHGESYFYWSWYSLNNNTFEGVLPTAIKVASMLDKDDEMKIMLNLNIAHAYILSDDYASAQSIYEKYKGYTFKNGRTWDELAVIGIIKLYKNDVTHPGFRRILNDTFNL
jgi:tetratricopeptide (TPR) repeat protein